MYQETPYSQEQLAADLVAFIAGGEAREISSFEDLLEPTPTASNSTSQLAVESVDCPAWNAIEGASLDAESISPSTSNEVVPQAGPSTHHHQHNFVSNTTTSGVNAQPQGPEVPQSQHLDVDQVPVESTPPQDAEYTISIGGPGVLQEPLYHYGTLLPGSSHPQFLTYDTIAASLQNSVLRVDVPTPRYRRVHTVAEHPTRSSSPPVIRTVFGSDQVAFTKVQRMHAITFLASHWDVPLSTKGLKIPKLRKLNPGKQPARRSRNGELVWLVQDNHAQYGYPQPVDHVGTSTEGAGMSRSVGTSVDAEIGASSSSPGSSSPRGHLARDVVWKFDPSCIPLLLCERVHGRDEQNGWEISGGSQQVLPKSLPKLQEDLVVVFKWPGYDNFLSVETAIKLADPRDPTKIVKKSAVCKALGTAYLKYLEELAKLDVQLTPEFALWRLSRDGGADGGITPEMVFIKDLYEPRKGVWHVTASVFIDNTDPNAASISGLQANDSPSRGPPVGFM
ncbi:hypothetical protein BDN72DRAFT_155327 [Pluteus cervinus]|uniref:Uncharacterized protein n=1 Tax=Pluteus cervinus TaxID=181527 RepID=A0ACD3AKA4_9AGAR|nr:hypothetical protein BDN72DRAFT_155327 [Pluteus cervinus]